MHHAHRSAATSFASALARPLARRCARPLVTPFATTLAALCAMGMGAAAHAQMSPALDRASVSLGAFSASPEIDARVGSGFGTLDTGTVDGGRKTMPRVSGELMLGDHHGLSFDAFRYGRSVSDDVVGTFSSSPFAATVATNLRTSFDLDVARLGYRYWFGTGATVVGVGAGVGYYRVGLRTSASGTAAAGLTGLGFTSFAGNYVRDDSADAFAPMLEVGIRHAVTPDLRLFAEGSGIYKGSGNLHGSIYNALAGVEWFPVRNVGLSLAYSVTDIDLRRGDSGLQQARLKFHGPVAAVKARF